MCIDNSKILAKIAIDLRLKVALHNPMITDQENVGVVLPTHIGNAAHAFDENIKFQELTIPYDKYLVGNI